MGITVVDGKDQVTGPVPLILWCPMCHERHIDPPGFPDHRTHACMKCGFLWAPSIVATVGVQFLPGCAPDPDPAYKDKLGYGDAQPITEAGLKEHHAISRATTLSSASHYASGSGKCLGHVAHDAYMACFSVPSDWETLPTRDREAWDKAAWAARAVDLRPAT